MRITSFENVPVLEIPFLNAGRGPGDFFVDRLPVHLGQVTGLPEELDALIATADLQGRETFQEAMGGPIRLLGEVLPERLAADILPALNLSPARTGVILAGDFFTVPNLDRRGGSGDVSSVWQAFARQFKWVAGVAGNHDLFGHSPAPARRISANSHYLDAELVTLDGLSIAGIGGIVGNPEKPHRSTEKDLVEQIERLSVSAPRLFVMHDGPDDPVRGQRGSPVIRQALERVEPTLLVRGHAHWNEPCAVLSNRTQVLNVDCRVAILRR